MEIKFGKKSGFTLIELLIVIAIIAILATVVILSLNPAELLRQARDSNRVSDAATFKSAIALYIADVQNPSMGSAAKCYVSIGTSTFYVPSTAGSWASATACTNWMSTASSLNNSTSTGVTGSGWLPINFSSISSGSPIGKEDVDPVNQAGTSGCVGTTPNYSSCGLFYSFISSGTNYKIGMMMESTKYNNGGNGDIVSTDGGTNNYVYEQGSDLNL